MSAINQTSRAAGGIIYHWKDDRYIGTLRIESSPRVLPSRVLDSAAEEMSLGKPWTWKWHARKVLEAWARDAV